VPDDAKSLIFAKAGREGFVNPEGAPIVYTLRQPDWEPRRHRQSHQTRPAGVDSLVEPLIGIRPVWLGKGTLLQMVAGLDAPSSGANVVDGKGPARGIKSAYRSSIRSRLR
jgi:hypothetical protein